ncbi:MAG: processing protein [Actinomycetota bacterium]|nr:processing protein [Actinomycetota bacterium]
MTTPLRSSLLSQDRFARAAWSRIAEPGDPVAARLIRTNGPVAALELAAIGAQQNMQRFQPRLEVLDVERDLEIGAKFAARVVCPGDPEWPSGLDDLEAPPYCLWIRGPVDVGSSCQRSAAVVGARSATAYGEMVATEMAAGLGERRFTIISGAAFGIDAAAHRGALATGATTIAVLAGGVERPYPSSHAALIARIVEVGAVISEVAPGSAPTKTRFLQRNRMIATMGGGTVVVEAGLRSGSLNTARTAAAHGRVVAAVPGPVTSMMSAGCHEAIRSGMAMLVTDAAEAAEAVWDYGSDLAPARRGPALADDGLDEHEAQLLSALPVRKGVPISRLAVSSGLSVPEVRSLLGRLDLIGLAERHGEGWRQARRVAKS